MRYALLFLLTLSCWALPAAARSQDGRQIPAGAVTQGKITLRCVPPNKVVLNREARLIKVYLEDIIQEKELEVVFPVGKAVAQVLDVGNTVRWSSQVDVPASGDPLIVDFCGMRLSALNRKPEPTWWEQRLMRPQAAFLAAVALPLVAVAPGLIVPIGLIALALDISHLQAAQQVGLKDGDPYVQRVQNSLILDLIGTSFAVIGTIGCLAITSMLAAVGIGAALFWPTEAEPTEPPPVNPQPVPVEPPSSPAPPAEPVSEGTAGAPTA